MSRGLPISRSQRPSKCLLCPQSKRPEIICFIQICHQIHDQQDAAFRWCDSSMTSIDKAAGACVRMRACVPFCNVLEGSRYNYYHLRA